MNCIISPYYLFEAHYRQLDLLGGYVNDHIVLCHSIYLTHSHPKTSSNWRFWPYVNIQHFRAPFNIS